MPEVLARYENWPIKVVRGYPASSMRSWRSSAARRMACSAARRRFFARHAGLGLVVPVLRSSTWSPTADPRSVHSVTRRRRRCSSFERAAAARARLESRRRGCPAISPGILRRSYLKTVESREYVEEAIKRNLDVGRPNTGEEITDYVTNTLNGLSAETIREYRSTSEKQ